MMIGKELRCEYCDEKVSYGDNYENHLITIHGLRKGVQEIMSRALERIKNLESQPKVIEEITLDDSDDEDVVENHAAKSKAILPIKLEKLEASIEKSLDESIKNMFSNLNLIIDGMLPEEETKDQSNDVDCDDMAELPEEIAVCFDELRSIADEIDFSNIFKTMEKKDANEKKVADQIVEAKSQEKVVKRNKPLGPRPKPGQTLFLCPVNGCSFYTTKEGFKNKEAASHLSNDHKVTLKDMVPGKYKFDKIKGEKLR